LFRSEYSKRHIWNFRQGKRIKNWWCHEGFPFPWCRCGVSILCSNPIRRHRRRHVCSGTAVCGIMPEVWL
jgi:hypothetical protein